MNRPITVCQLLHSLTVGGAEILAARLARRLRESFRFVFACLDEIGPLGRQLMAEGFRVHLISRRPGLDWRCPLRLARILRRERVDVLHAHQYTPFFYGLAARLRGPRRPIVFTEHGRHQPDFPRRKRMIANRLLISRHDRLLGVGSAVRDALIANEGMPSDRVFVLYNGIDVDAFSAAASRSETRKTLGVDPDEFVLIQVARLDYLKDHATAIRTLARVVADHSRVKLVLIGDGPERAAIEAIIDQLNVRDYVRLLGTRHDVAQLLPGADAFLLTSTSEGIPLTVLEAMAAGLPIVATNVGGLSEIVADGETGCLAPARSDADLASHILELINQPEMRFSMGAAGRLRVKDKFDERRMCSDYHRIYEELARV